MMTAVWIALVGIGLAVVILGITRAARGGNRQPSTGNYDDGAYLAASGAGFASAEGAGDSCDTSDSAGGADSGGDSGGGDGGGGGCD